MKTKTPPFYENFDGTHCAQCVLRGVLEYFEPNKVWTWQELDVFTNKEPDKWTWPYRGMMNMVTRGYDVVNFGGADVKDYIENGVYETLLAELGKEAADACRKWADLVDVVHDMKAFRHARENGSVKDHRRAPTVADMKDLLDKGYLVFCSLNSARLYGNDGYEGHAVLVYGIDDEFVHYHDSGRPPKLEWKMPIDQFIAACTDPTPSQWEMTAYKL